MKIVSRTFGFLWMLFPALAQAQSTIAFATNSMSLAEQNTTVQIAVTRSGSAAGTASVQYETLVSNLATAGKDYVATSGTLMFGDQETQKSISLTLLDDEFADAQRTVGLRIFNPSNATLGTPSTFSVFVNDNDLPPTLSYSSLVFAEGNGTRAASFTVTLSKPLDMSLTISFRLLVPPGGGLPANDYNGASAIPQNVVLAAGETSKAVTVMIIGNETYESAPKTFSFVPQILTSPVSRDVTAPNFTITLTEDDPIPTLSVSDVSVTEGGPGETKTVLVTVTASRVMNGTFEWRLIPGTASLWSAPSNLEGDYFRPGLPVAISMRNTTTATIGVTPANPGDMIRILGDSRVEADETFQVELYNVVNGAAGNRGTVTILNDDAATAAITPATLRAEVGDSPELTIHFSAPVPATSIALTSSSSAVVVPASVNVPANAQSVSFRVEVRSAGGPVTITAALPAVLGGGSVASTLTPFVRSDVQATPDRVTLYAGATTSFALSFDPVRGGDTVVVIASVGGVQVPATLTIPAGGSVPLHATATIPGRAEILVTPAIAGAASKLIVLDVLAPTVASTSPKVSSTSGGTVTTIRGAGFSPACIVSFGGVAAQSVEYVDANTLLAITPAHAAGAADVVVTCGAVPITSPDSVQYVSSRRRASRH